VFTLLTLPWPTDGSGRRVIEVTMPDIEIPPPGDASEPVQIDRDIVDRFRLSGEGWERRLNDALREAAGMTATGASGRRPEELNAANDD
jgi:hypothetical protein